MKPQSRKSKGREFQKTLVAQIYEAFPELEEGDVEWCSMGAGGIDIILSPKARRVFPISIEAKNTKTKPGPGAVRQANYNRYPDTTVCVAWKPPRANMKDSMVMMEFTELIELIKRVRDEGERQ